VESFFIVAGAPSGNQAEVISARCIDDSPIFAADNADGEVPFLASPYRRDRNDRTLPERRSGREANAMFGLVDSVLGRVPFESHL